MSAVSASASCIGIILAMAILMFLQKPIGHESADGSKINEEEST
ncbi:hypothetical protein L291_2493 [Acinetobacter guillouiae MSP4-18]|nr:hypothetical protein [Acinetobacter guillouiae]ENU56733.1 hypothetical protein F981_04240 [Acinetobacter guillouiae CIP 63.46]EPH34286.1 hypothetical protein L291_2493 [Acinetobacter guillouiae MSP4-18]